MLAETGVLLDMLFLITSRSRLPCSCFWFSGVSEGEALGRPSFFTLICRAFLLFFLSSALRLLRELNPLWLVGLSYLLEVQAFKYSYTVSTSIGCFKLDLNFSPHVIPVKARSGKRMSLALLFTSWQSVKISHWDSVTTLS